MNFKVKIQFMRDICRIIAVLSVFLTLCTSAAREELSLTVYGDKLYLTDGFFKKITVYDNELNEVRTVGLKNVSAAGFFDCYSIFDPYRSYLNDAVSGIIWQLDDKFEVKEKLDVLKKFGTALSGYIYPHMYNSLIIATREKDQILILRNSVLTELISFQSAFSDFRCLNDEILVLSGSNVRVYTASGALKIVIPFDREFEKIRPSENMILLYAKGEAILFDRSAKESVTYSTGEVTDLCLFNKSLIMIPAGERKPVRTDF